MDSDPIPQRPAETIECNLHDVAVGEPNAFSEAKTVSAKKMNVNVSRVAVRFILEVMVFDILQTVAHLRLTGADLFSPQLRAGAFNHDFASDRLELRVDDKLGADRTGPQFRTSQIEVILLFKTVIRKFVAHRHTNAARLALRINHVDAGDLRLFSAILCV